MSRPVVCNSLLRVDGVKGVPIPPFERPNGEMDFLVWEFGSFDSMDGLYTEVCDALRTRRDELAKLQRDGARAVLFVECVGENAIVEFEASFLSTVSSAGISLEVWFNAGK